MSTLEPLTPAQLRSDLNHPSLPYWDRESKKLWVGDRLVKHFHRDAANQQLILAAFQELSWSHRILDPLPPSPGIDPKRRLHDTIKFLNQNQIENLIHFRGDGTGQAIRWEFIGT